MSSGGKRRGGPPEGHGGDERWVISYADLVTLLLGFFIILYSTSKVDADKFKLFAFGLNTAFNVDVKGAQQGGSPVLDGGRGLLPGPINTGTIARKLKTAVDEICAAMRTIAGSGRLRRYGSHGFSRFSATVSPKLKRALTMTAKN